MNESIRTRPITDDERAIVAGHEQMRAELAALRERNKRMRGFIQRLGYGHTDWPEQNVGCEQPGPGCVAQCTSRCSNVDHLNATIYELRADLARLRAVWRAVAGYFGDTDLPEELVDAAVEAGLAERVPFDEEAHAGDPDLVECQEGDIITVLTPDGERLARGGA